MALGDADVVAIKDVDGPVAVLVIFKMNSLSLVFLFVFLFLYFSIWGGLKRSKLAPVTPKTNS